MSHITAGYMASSTSSSTVRVDEAYAGGLASSLFNYANVTSDGLVDNTLTTFAPPENVTVWRGYVNSNFPLFSADLLVRAGAVFAGLATRELVPGKVALVGCPCPLYRAWLTRLWLLVEYHVPRRDSRHRWRGRVWRRGWV